MKHLAILIITVAFTLCGAQELGLEGESGATEPTLEEELKLIGVDDLIVNEVVPATPKNESIKVDSQKVEISASVKESVSNLPVDTTVVPKIEGEVVASTVESISNVDSSAVLDTVVTIDSVANQISTAEVSSVRTVDIQGSLEGYRSPLKAMFFSLAVPGAGQAYTKKYWKTGVFVAAEIVAIVGAVKFKKTADAIQKDAHAVVDQHFSSQKLSGFFNDLVDYGVRVNPTFSRDSIANFLLNSPVDTYIKSFETDVYGNAKILMNAQGWSDATPKYNKNASASTSFYLIEGTEYTLDTTNLRLTGDHQYGRSAQQDHYISLLDASEKRSGWSQTMVTAILLNHVVSATDAFITAHRQNRNRMNEKIESEPRVSVSNNTYRNELGILTTSLDVAWKF